MCLIILVIIELVLNILILACHPKKGHYEITHFYDVYYNYTIDQNYDYNYNNYYEMVDTYTLIEKFVEELNTSKRINQAVLAFAIISFIISFLLCILTIYNKCKYHNKNDDINSAVFFFLTIQIILTFINWAMSLAIVAKVNKIRKKKGDEIGFTDKIKSGIVIVIILLTLDLILDSLQIHKSGNVTENNSTSYVTNTIKYNANVRTTTNSNVETTRPVVIRVRQQKVIVSLKRVLSYEMFSKIKKIIERGKLILLQLKSFYLQMNFIGLSTEDDINKEIATLVFLIGEYLKGQGNEIARICIDNYNDEDAIWILLEYLFPLIVSIIKLKIELGLYKRIEGTITRQVSVLIELERRIERDENGSLKQTFRYRQQISQSTLVNLLR